MRAELSEFLRQHPACCTETAQWDYQQQKLLLRTGTHLCHVVPPLDELITSVRAVVCRAELVLAVRDQHGHHLVPGGRREPGETCVECLRREILEETGCEIEVLGPIGFLHYQHASPKPPGYPYPYPNFLQLVYVARTSTAVPRAPIAGEFELRVFFHPLDKIEQLHLGPRDLHFLAAARSALNL